MACLNSMLQVKPSIKARIWLLWLSKKNSEHTHQYPLKLSPGKSLVNSHHFRYSHKSLPLLAWQFWPQIYSLWQALDWGLLLSKSRLKVNDIQEFPGQGTLESWPFGILGPPIFILARILEPWNSLADGRSRGIPFKTRFGGQSRYRLINHGWVVYTKPALGSVDYISSPSRLARGKYSWK